LAKFNELGEKVEGGRKIHKYEENQVDKKLEKLVVKSKSRSHQ